MAVILAACTADARREVTPDPLIVRIGTLGTVVEGGQTTAARLAAILSLEPLVSVGWHGRPVFRLAESADEAANGRTITVHLRPNAKFHNGDKVTASAVRRLLLPQVPAYAPAIADIEVPDESTLVLQLREPYSFKVVDLNNLMVDDDEETGMRTGPFKFVSDGEITVLERFSDYYRGTPLVERIEIQGYPTLRAAWTAMMRGELNFLHEVNRDAIEFIEAGGDIRAYPLLRPYYVALTFNMRHPVLRNADVRVAINEVIDRNEVVRRGMRGHGQPAEGPFWPHHWAYEAGNHTIAHNPGAARLRLDAAALPVRARGRDMPSRFQFTCLVLEGDTRFEGIALVIQRQLFEVGIDMQLESVPIAPFIERIKAGSFDAFLFEMASGRTLSFPYRMWHSSEAILPTAYDSANAALDRMRDARTDDEIRQAVADVMRVMRDDPPAAFLVVPREARAADRSLDIEYEPDRDIIGNLWQLRRAPVNGDESQ